MNAAIVRPAKLPHTRPDDFARVALAFATDALRADVVYPLETVPR